MNLEPRPVVGYEGIYTINANGEVFSARGRKIKPYKGTIGLSKDGKRKNHIVGRLVLEAFGTEPENESDVCHFIDGNKENTTLSNLEWRSRMDVIKEVVEDIEEEDNLLTVNNDGIAYFHYIMANFSLHEDIRSDRATYKDFVKYCQENGYKVVSLSTYRRAVSEFSDIYTTEAREPLRHAFVDFLRNHGQGDLYRFNKQGELYLKDAKQDERGR